MSVRLSTSPTDLPRTTVRDVLKTLVEIDNRRQIDRATGAALVQRATPSTDPRSDPSGPPATSGSVEHGEVPIQIGFGFGPARPKR